MFNDYWITIYKRTSYEIDKHGIKPEYEFKTL